MISSNRRRSRDLQDQSTQEPGKHRSAQDKRCVDPGRRRSGSALESLNSPETGLECSVRELSKVLAVPRSLVSTCTEPQSARRNSLPFPDSDRFHSHFTGLAHFLNTGELPFGESSRIVAQGWNRFSARTATAQETDRGRNCKTIMTHDMIFSTQAKQVHRRASAVKPLSDGAAIVRHSGPGSCKTSSNSRPPRRPR